STGCSKISIAMEEYFYREENFLPSRCSKTSIAMEISVCPHAHFHASRKQGKRLKNRVRPVFNRKIPAGKEHRFARFTQEINLYR
ncbi:MAG: hypothetical protein LBD27_07190, partial [Tannerella sp.]|nr:hypothetical protein [Tannerella sp.]